MSSLLFVLLIFRLCAKVETLFKTCHELEGLGVKLYLHTERPSLLGSFVEPRFQATGETTHACGKTREGEATRAFSNVFAVSNVFLCNLELQIESRFLKKL